MRHDDFCTYEQSQKLKELGFDWECYEFWDTTFCTDGGPVKIRKTKHEPKVCVMSECNSMLENMGSGLITAPTLAVAQKWLREKHQFFIHVTPCIWHKNNIVFDAHWIWSSNNGLKDDRNNGFPSYEAALSAAITGALSLLAV